MARVIGGFPVSRVTGLRCVSRTKFFAPLRLRGGFGLFSLGSEFRL